MWIRQDNELSFTAKDVEALPEIPVGNWLIKFDLQRGYYLEKTPAFKLPPKIYGDSEEISKRYLNTFASQNSNLGILLTGTKGTGKSVTAKLTCANSNLPVILITEPFRDDSFKSLLSNIHQEVIVFVDEFEKVYHATEYQNNFLSILDGIFEGKKMFLFTSNEKGKVNQYMLNRPGRVHYLREYDGLDEVIVNQVIADMLENQDNKKGLVETLNILGTVTMDILVSLIKEMNLYKETARESIKYLNLKPESSLYEIELFEGEYALGKARVNQHPLTAEFLDFSMQVDMYKYKSGAHNHAGLMSSLKYTKMDRAADVEDKSGEVAELAKELNKEPIMLSAQFKVDVKNSTVEQIGTTIKIKDDKSNLTYVFTKLTPYSFYF